MRKRCQCGNIVTFYCFCCSQASCIPPHPHGRFPVRICPACGKALCPLRRMVGHGPDCVSRKPLQKLAVSRHCMGEIPHMAAKLRPVGRQTTPPGVWENFLHATLRNSTIFSQVFWKRSPARALPSAAKDRGPSHKPDRCGQGSARADAEGYRRPGCNPGAFFVRKKAPRGRRPRIVLDMQLVCFLQARIPIWASRVKRAIRTG